jgi:ADP-ribose pyrophosphatase
MIVFQNKKFKIKTEKVKLPDSSTIDFASLQKNPGADILALIEKDTIILIRQYRPAVKKWIYQLPGGKIEDDETPIQNAIKELEEEIGYKAEKMKLIGKFYTSPHISNDLQYIFLARDLKKTKRHLEKGEQIKLKKVKLSTAYKMVANGKINDSTTIAALMILKNMNLK